MSKSRVEPWLVTKTVAPETSGLEARVYDRSCKIANNDFIFFTKESRRSYESRFNKISHRVQL